ncbi:MAG: hypothetical protein II659_07065, partial [Bacteroidales bacterium]|nr:hypothetical protein [Bacteroidales bacterium]
HIIMEDQTTIILTKEQLLIICSAIILAGMSSNYTTRYPSESHALVAQGVANKLMEIVLK